MKWFNDVWMKEVFANFIADKCTGASEDHLKYKLKLVTTRFPSAFSVDRTTGSNPIRQPLDNLQNAGLLYGPIIYQKAPVMMGQLEMLMGEEALRKGVVEYLKKYSYSNASWPDLINILDQYTAADLQAWNKVWVDETGRPIVTSDIIYENERVKQLSVLQQPEYGTGKIWKQAITINLYYKDSVKILNTYLDSNNQIVKAAEGLPRPLFIVLNASGDGYGVFETGKEVIEHFSLIKDPVTRAATYISMYENTLNNKGLSPLSLLHFFTDMAAEEQTELNLRLITGYINSLYWEFISKQHREKEAAGLEAKIWSALQLQQAGNNKKILFGTYQHIFTSDSAYQKLFNIWKSQAAPEGVSLTDDDYTALALALALRNNDNATLLNEQLSRIKNPDRISRFKIIVPAASSDKAVRDSFFYRLADKNNRTNESATGTALSLLFHPLRQPASIVYLPHSLALLQEIQKTGDIFFPDNWLRSTFSYFQTQEAMDVVHRFLSENPGYNRVLRNKILQATDNLARAIKLVKP